MDLETYEIDIAKKSSWTWKRWKPVNFFICDMITMRTCIHSLIGSLNYKTCYLFHWMHTKDVFWAWIIEYFGLTSHLQCFNILIFYFMLHFTTIQLATCLPTWYEDINLIGDFWWNLSLFMPFWPILQHIITKIYGWRKSLQQVSEVTETSKTGRGNYGIQASVVLVTYVHFGIPVSSSRHV